MAAPTDKTVSPYARGSQNGDSMTANQTTQINNLITALRVLAAKLDADAGVTDTNYFALTSDAALGAAAPTKLV